MSNRLDGSFRPELLPQPAHADLDDVRPRVEVVSPHLGEQTLAAHHLADVHEQVMKEPELAIREIRRAIADARLPPRDVEHDLAAAQDVLVTEGRRAAQPHPD